MMPMGGGFFGGAPPIFMLFFFLIFGVIFLAIISAIVSAVKNAKAPVITVQARVIAKRTEVSSHHHAGDNHSAHHSSSTYYYITFETEHGERLELPLSGRMFGLLIEGDEGNLTYQGEWFKDFRRFDV
jgi:hypothetical protein